MKMPSSIREKLGPSHSTADEIPSINAPHPSKHLTAAALSVVQAGPGVHRDHVGLVFPDCQQPVDHVAFCPDGGAAAVRRQNTLGYLGRSRKI